MSGRSLRNLPNMYGANSVPDGVTMTEATSNAL